MHACMHAAGIRYHVYIQADRIKHHANINAARKRLGWVLSARLRWNGRVQHLSGNDRQFDGRRAGSGMYVYLRMAHSPHFTYFSRAYMLQKEAFTFTAAT